MAGQSCPPAEGRSPSIAAARRSCRRTAVSSPSPDPAPRSLSLQRWRPSIGQDDHRPDRERKVATTAASGGTKAVIAALLANTGIAITKFIAYLLTGASSMLAEAVHSVADAGNQVLLLIGGRHATREADATHPFGHGRVRYVYAFVVSIVLFAVGGLFALYEAWHKYEEVHAGHPNQLLDSQWWWVPLAVLGVAIVMEGLSLRTAVLESNKLRGGKSWVSFIRRAKAPELPVILLEDVGALLGLVFALIGVGMTLISKNGYWDVAGTAAIGILLVIITVILAIEMSSLLI